ncbi:hypothetical protein TNIN_312641 [Trichonephila inaurata madagascariensis]|uniref:Uncharacterized protein n=1 Tax=Trichonephila inaurata madagascariensis TaxID=2747483 RepID=A0A8X6MBV0_9ARAC|nr:hypothetical protein TNIN_312641 [Trichonephila inaurata madagascariensis]
MHENEKKKINFSHEHGPQFRQELCNSGTYTNLHEQRPPVGGTGRIASTYSILWLLGEESRSPGPAKGNKKKLPQNKQLNVAQT